MSTTITPPVAPNGGAPSEPSGTEVTPVTFPITGAQKDAHKFRLYGLTYLLATPSDFAQSVVPQGQSAISTWLTNAGVTDPNSQTILLKFVSDMTSDIVIPHALKTLQGTLRDNFGTPSADIGVYTGPICPNKADSISIMEKMVELDGSASGNAAAPTRPQ